MNATLICRQATAGDAVSLQNLAANTWRQFESVIGADSWTFLSAALDKVNYAALIDSAYGVLVEDAGRIVGMAFLVPSGNPTDIFSADWCYVRMVTVDAAYNGQGIGRRLMELCVARAKTDHEKVIALHTSEFMNAARRIYESIGFRIERELEPRFGKRYWLYTMNLH